MEPTWCRPPRPTRRRSTQAARPLIIRTRPPIITTQLAKRCLDWFLPPLCLGCRSTPPDGIDPLNLCPHCRRFLRPATGRCCRTCPTRIEDPSAPPDFVCGSCRRRPPPWNRLVTGWSYEPPLRQVVIALKFGRLEYLADALASEVANRHGTELARATAIVPVPLHWWRNLARGYNQADLLARALGHAIDRPVVHHLSRRRFTQAQTGLDRAARRRNLRGAFAWRGADASAQHWLLVDDVYTTGATLESAARALRQAGARKLTALAIAATPHPLAGQSRIQSRNSPPP